MGARASSTGGKPVVAFMPTSRLCGEETKQKWVLGGEYGVQAFYGLSFLGSSPAVTPGCPQAPGGQTSTT